MTNKINWDSVYNDFDINKNYIWLNNAGTTSAGRHVVETMKQYYSSYAESGIYGAEFPYVKIIGEIKNSLSLLLNCNEDDIAIIHNTSEGMNLISWGLNLHPGDEFIVLENEYPSNIYPWEHWQAKGVKFNTVPISNSPDQFIKNLTKCITGKTRAAALTAVHWCTGMPLPLKKISEICEKNNIELIIDASQGAGHINIDMTDMGLDYLCFSAWKWLLGPLGLGVMAVTEKKLRSLNHHFKGTGSVVDPDKYFPYRNEIKPTAERYIYSTPNFNDWVYFYASLNYLKNLGFENVQNRIFKLGQYLTDNLAELGFIPVYDSSMYAQTGIIVVEKDGIDCGKLARLLYKNNIIVRERLGRLRLSPHIYNSFDQLDKVVEVIKRLLPEASS